MSDRPRTLYEKIWDAHVVERREVRGVNCNCGPGEGRSYRSSYQGDEGVVSYRD